MRSVDDQTLFKNGRAFDVFIFFCASPLCFTQHMELKSCSFQTSTQSMRGTCSSPSLALCTPSHFFFLSVLWQYLMAKSLFFDLARIGNDEQPLGLPFPLPGQHLF